MNRHLHTLGRIARRKIGAHHRMIGDSRFTNNEYINVQRESDEWVALIKYLIQTLDNRDHAVQLAQYAGMPGYINMR